MSKPYRVVIDARNPTQDLTTLASVKLDLGLDPLDTSNDDWINAQIKQASNAIGTMCNRMFGAETLSNYFRLDWGYHGPLELSRIPVTEILSVNESGGDLTIDDFEVDEESGLLWRTMPEFSHCAWSGNSIHVQFVAGYQLLATLPYDLERAANILIKGSYYAKNRDPSVRSESIPGVMSFDYGSTSVSHLDSASELQRLITPYKLPAYG